MRIGVFTLHVFGYTNPPSQVVQQRMKVHWGSVWKKLSCWKGKLMSYGGRLILIISVLTSMPMFLLSFFEVPLSFFEVPVGVRKRLDFYWSRFFWQSDERKRKYRLAKWDIICRPNDQGGHGIENLEVKNRCLLSKWLYKLSIETEATVLLPSLIEQSL